ncbi:transglycosylase SLT domain-containing protein [Microbacterium hydrocarbonoxydans]|uniref:aggregation-promoting factor C-terminal-like domain-containing protein n=1 Tax=Microbacterium hydrocarbonoxydans TaxID=273678 RepID=UPI0020406E75|nr:transglycosylase SLT domain-containing protein [Microbacterium hydrocarbonoxydans]MCM3778967.1 transglycosylase SLT domain-containing protein [Microbacterium hydrocarbonoxydans]
MNSRNDMLTHRNDRSPVPASRVLSPRVGTRRRGIVGFFSALAVVGFAAAMVAPTGVALAEQPVEAGPESAYAAALADTQNITVAVEGAEIAPVQRGTFSVYVTPKPTPTPTVAASTTEKSSSGGGGPLFYTGGGAPAEWMAAAGIAESDWGYVDYIVSRESGWNPNATNKSSGACGLVQALPCSKVPGNGYDPVDNLRWATGYATGRYGSWAGAHAFWTKNHWW